MTCHKKKGELMMKAMKMSEGGRVVVPAEIRKALNVRDGDVVYWELVDGEARLTTKLARLRRSQEMAQRRFPSEPGVSLAADLIADRRQEAEQD
jgi:bifunctional DNA-binding transcriptional regulator/antitoxin component of YhaV-PrlF toxin-antitoxin module